MQPVLNSGLLRMNPVSQSAVEESLICWRERPGRRQVPQKHPERYQESEGSLLIPPLSLEGSESKPGHLCWVKVPPQYYLLLCHSDQNTWQQLKWKKKKELILAHSVNPWQRGCGRPAWCAAAEAFHIMVDQRAEQAGISSIIFKVSSLPKSCHYLGLRHSKHETARNTSYLHHNNRWVSLPTLGFLRL